MIEKLVEKNFDFENLNLSKLQENDIISLAEHYSKNNCSNQLRNIIKATRPFLNQVSKAKSGKLVRTLVDLYLEMEVSAGDEVELCKECIEWTINERRNYLRQNLEAKLMGVYYIKNQFEEALNIGSALLKELKKLDDKGLLVEVQLLESKVYYSLSNLQRSKAALTSARTTANGIYCPPKLQASLDIQSGILHAADERDFKTAYSYFYEAFEGFDGVDSRRALIALKYMLMSKIMLNCSDEVPQILTGKLPLKYTGKDIDAMREIAQAANKRSLSRYIEILEKYKENLTTDPVISKHLYSLYDNLLGQNLIKLIEPYSRVQIEYLAGLIDLPLDTVERKLSQMILDKKMNGFLNQESGVLILFDDSADDQGYKVALEQIHNLSPVVDQLYLKAKKLY